MYPDLRDHYGIGYDPYMMGYGHPSYGMWGGMTGCGCPSYGVGYHHYPHHHMHHYYGHHHGHHHIHPQNTQIQLMSLNMPMPGMTTNMMHP
jgi:hypothetical protein